jgi:YidC/Oxa1 family membrane protein insertase
MMTNGLRIFVALFTCLMMQSAQADRFTVTAGNSEILFDAAAGVPVRWVICAPLCADVEANRTVLMDQGDGYIRVTTPEGPGGVFVASVTESADEVSVEFVAQNERYVYRLSRFSPEIDIELPANASLAIASGQAFVPEQLPGFSQMYSRVHVVQVSADGQSIYEFEDNDEGGIAITLPANDTNWTGVRNRYWALLAQPAGGPQTAKVEFSGQDRPVVKLAPESDLDRASVRLYAGPVEWRHLQQVSPVLSEMLFAALWDFLRALCFGMLLLLEWLQGLVGSFGVAIILLSLSVKILMSPLTLVAERWQADVNRIQTLLKPELDEIKMSYKGEEAHWRTLAVYKKHDVSMLYTFKSAAGFMIQIPIFIAAFDMLSENFALNEIAFLWISDLAKPDSLTGLPFVLPFFGGSLNLLPFLMTGLSLLAAWLQSEDTLSPALQRQQTVRLYLMGAAFFVLFYTFPAGMVLYWTASNLFHLLKVELGRLFKRFKK